MTSTQFYVAVHRWFRNGEDWAYHPALNEIMDNIYSDIRPIIQRGRRKILQGRRWRFCEDIGHTWLVGTMASDTSCLYEKSQNRNPFVLTFAVVSDAELSNQKALAICEELELLETPDSPGISPALAIKLSDEPYLSLDYEDLISPEEPLAYPAPGKARVDDSPVPIARPIPAIAEPVRAPPLQRDNSEIVSYLSKCAALVALLGGVVLTVALYIYCSLYYADFALTALVVGILGCLLTLFATIFRHVNVLSETADSTNDA